MAARPVTPPHARRPGSGSTTCTRPSTITLGWRTRRSCPTRRAPLAERFARAAQYFTTHGITIERVITDNHFSYRRSNDVAATITAIGAKHVFIKPYCPWQNGKVERFNRTLQTEWAYRQVFTTNAARSAALAPWLEYYNNQRRHSAIGGQPPISRLSPT
ncbi:hypothetical protein MTER_11640 [Mycolicibacter terrae]|uniref:Integrase catalytic domain-containing protein n=1 Tax=Mycolicibacter terrae TaxID=1788 RepID=A0AAD1HWC8_9MYCO|nr:hypothetical protein MTER_11640 [Mycolicibacter terrae]